MKENDINHFTMHNEKQANYVERFVKTIKNKDRKYIDILQPMVDSYNKTWHSGIQSEPINVNKGNERRLWWQMYSPKYYPREEIKKKKRKRYRKRLFAYKVGDKVRISQLKSAFPKRI